MNVLEWDKRRYIHFMPQIDERRVRQTTTKKEEEEEESIDVKYQWSFF